MNKPPQPTDREPESAVAEFRGAPQRRQPAAERGVEPYVMRALDATRDAVVMIEKLNVAWGTGFVVAPGLVLTARHLAEELAPNKTLMHFRYERGADGSFTGTASRDWQILFTGADDGILKTLRRDAPIDGTGTWIPLRSIQATR